jgi:hypothetical protein
MRNSLSNLMKIFESAMLIKFGQHRIQPEKDLN